MAIENTNTVTTVTGNAVAGAVATGATSSQANNSPLASAVRRSLQEITGEKDILSAKGASLMALLENCNYETAQKILKKGCIAYEGMKKYPSTSFWRSIKIDVLRVEEMQKPKPKPKIADEETERVKQIAKYNAEKFAPKKAVGENVSLLEKKLARYRKYIQDDLVRVEERGHSLDQKWIPRKQAHSIGVEYHDPVEYMEARKESILK